MMKQAVWRTWRRKRETNLRWMSGAWRDVGRSMGIPWGNVRWRLRGWGFLGETVVFLKQLSYLGYENDLRKPFFEMNPCMCKFAK
jgi:hypothetical protein